MTFATKRLFAPIFLLLILHLAFAFGQENLFQVDSPLEASDEQEEVEEPSASALSPDAVGHEEHHSMSSFSSTKEEKKFEQDANGNMVPVVDKKEEQSGHSRDKMSRKFNVKDGKMDFFDVKAEHESGSGPLSPREMDEFDREEQKLEAEFKAERAKLEARFDAERKKLERQFKRFEVKM